MSSSHVLGSPAHLPANGKEFEVSVGDSTADLTHGPSTSPANAEGAPAAPPARRPHTLGWHPATYNFRANSPQPTHSGTVT
ncbi:hypothetical protein EYF80_019520 [Liparis tanakae]|uniref:Uncharacterized protein n=1 Tax=Liparis tanakae TaxID=230148 RepID=A0A4Z2HWR9_9TELE|nr:hypothetical protein EYF80_019520 [Liparis tanakae]